MNEPCVRAGCTGTQAPNMNICRQCFATVARTRTYKHRSEIVDMMQRQPELPLHVKRDLWGER